MKTLALRFTPLSAFGTPPMGDTLFGQLCWAIRNRYGEPALTKRLEGYTEGNPFAVVSDASPAGHVPRPALPGSWYEWPRNRDRKEGKTRRWLPLVSLSDPLSGWLQSSRTDEEVVGGSNSGRGFVHAAPQTHNSIDRRTGTTGGAEFAPYSQTQHWYHPGVVLECHVLLDTDRLSADELMVCLSDIGSLGFGRDASIGLGKFQIDELTECELPAHPDPNACLTLAPCAPQGRGFDFERSYYPLFTRFGRHGDIAVHESGKPFKNPVLMAGAGAVFSVTPPETGFIGQGLGGNGVLSKAIEATVQQAYSPVIPIHLPEHPEYLE